MDLFGKKYFENQDFLTQSVEPYECEFNELLSALPAVIDITIDMLKVTSYGVDVERSNILDHIVERSTEIENKKLYREHSYRLEKLFKVEASPETTINFKTNTITGSIQMIKLKDQLDESEVLELMSSVVYNTLPDWRIDHERANEIIELLDLELSHMRRLKRMRSDRNKNREIKRVISEKIIETKEWNIRSVEFAQKVCQMIKDYIQDGKEDALRDFILFKMMTHSKHPIYAME